MGSTTGFSSHAAQADSCSADTTDGLGSATTGELGVRPEEVIAANGAVIFALGIGFPVFTCESPFCTFIAGYVIHVFRQYFLPFGIAYMQVRSIGAGVVWIIFVVRWHSCLVLCIAAL